MRCVRTYDSNLSVEKCIRLELGSSDPFILPSVSILATGLEHIWLNRSKKKRTALFSIRAELENAIAIKRKSRLGKLKECADIMENMIENFLY